MNLDELSKLSVFISWRRSSSDNSRIGMG